MRRISTVLLLSLFIQIGFTQTTDSISKEHAVEWKRMNASKKATFDWFRDAKYGMFIHWGLYSIPAGVWNGKTLKEYKSSQLAEWIMSSAKIPRAEYAELANQFNPVKFNADSIALLAKEAGMRYVVLTSKHHDGFAMYQSAASKFNIVDATAFKRDVLRELYDACKRQGLDFGVYYSHNIDWMDGGDGQLAEAIANKMNVGIKNIAFGANTWDPSPNTFEEYLQKKAYPQVKELMHNYPDLKCLWYDMPARLKPEQSYEFYKIVYDIQPQVIITERIGNGLGDYIIPGDNKIPVNANGIAKPWETVGTHNNSWGYKSYDNDWKTPKEMLYWLIEIVSKGGNYMLNIGPTSEGLVPQQSANNLRVAGKWLKINGEAIYGTQKWKIMHEGPTNLNMEGTTARSQKGFKANFTPEDFWFTQKGKSVYAISIEKPTDEAVVKSFNPEIGKIKKAEILGIGKVKFVQNKDGLTIKIPKGFSPENGCVIKVSF